MSTRAPEPPDFPASQLFLRRLAFRLVHDEARAEDLVQDTWATWVERKPRGLAEPRAWLARVLRNRAFNAKRTDERRARREHLAGSADASAPEVDGTLEAQAQLIEALRKLEEPYRSTLVERYYHDLSPSEIAGRSGAPLNTVKARLARGLEKLRGEMDRRYGGDRSAWCHWLTVLGAPPVPLAAPPSGAAGTRPSIARGTPDLAPYAGMGGSGGMSLLGWLALGAVLVAGAVLKSDWGRGPRVEAPAAEGRLASTPLSETPGRREERRVPVEATEPSAPPMSKKELTAYGVPSRPPPSVQPEAVARPTSPAPEDFDWPQYGGSASHDNYRKREDEISAPRVLWFVPGCEGQPTLEGGDLYTGGLTVMRLDPDTGMTLDFASDLLSAELLARIKVAVQKAVEGDSTALEALQRLFNSGDEGEKDEDPFDLNDGVGHMVAPAPVITPKLVLARRTLGGGVSAFDRRLRKEVWRWDSGWEETSSEAIASTRIPLCLTEGGIVLVNLRDQIVALRVSDGREQWRYSVNGAIEMAPAESGGRVYFGTDRGLFVALAASTGELLWQVTAEGFGSAAPVVVGGRVLAVGEHGAMPGQSGPSTGGKLYAWDARNGMPLWEAPLFRGQGSTGPGIDEGTSSVVACQSSFVQLFDLASGKNKWGREPMRMQPANYPQGTPALVGENLVIAQDRGRLSVFALAGEQRQRWSFQLPGGVEIQDFVATGKRIYVSTSIGLFCLADDPTLGRAAAGFVLEWNGDPRMPSYVEGESPEKRAKPR